MGELSFLGWIVLGGLAGWIASKIMKTDQKQGLIANIVIGIVGAFIGGFVINALGGQAITGFNPWSFLVALIGAVILIWLLKLIRK